MAAQKLKFITYDLSSSQNVIENKAIYRIDNFRFTPENYLIFDRGWEPLKRYPTEATHQYIDDDFEPTRSLFVFNRHNGAELYYLHEKDSQMLYEWGNGDGQVLEDRYFIASNRHIPAPHEASTQFLQIDDYCIIANGVDPVFKFWGHTKVTPFGLKAPPAPVMWTIDPTFKTDQTFSGEPATCQDLPEEGFFGVVPDNTLGVFSYGYRYSYVSDTGSEGPLSEPDVIEFNILENQSGRYIVHGNISKGPDNVVARRIYRTINLGNNGGGEGTYYFVKQINNNTDTFFSDSYPDALLSSLAPGYDTPGNLIVPINNFQFMAEWENRLWVSGGDYPSTVLYSAQTQDFPPKGPETFTVLGRINFGTGGKVWAIKPFDKYLIIFREHSIEYIYKLSDGTFAFTTLTSEIGTTASNSIQAVPNFGLVFLAYDGFYVIALASEGSISRPIISKISDSINKSMKYLNLSALPRSTGVWNPIEKEYWCHFPHAGDTENTKGAVLHANGFWTFRGSVNTEQHNRRFTITHLAFDGRYTVMGMYPWDETVEEGDSGPIEDGTWRNVGLQVWSAADQWSAVLDEGTDVDGTYTFKLGEGTRGNARIETSWFVFSDPAVKKVIRNLYIYALGTGFESLTLEVATNHRNVFEEVGSRNAVHPEDRLTKNDTVYGSITPPQRGAGVWGTSVCNDYRPITLRFSGMDLKEVDAFKFRIITNNYIGIKGFSIEYDETDSKTQR